MYAGKCVKDNKIVKGHYWADNVDREIHYIQTFDPETLKVKKDYEVHKGSVYLLRESQIIHTWIPYHVDQCSGCTDIIHDPKGYNVIFVCNECGEKRRFILEDDISLPVGFLSAIIPEGE